ncbi:hypothetical protein FB451DRAFT_1453881 [Mycena latifolia]|nr:hypothetical protein FB451DRAFT_1453881 [Mycena latifolia]
MPRPKRRQGLTHHLNHGASSSSDDEENISPEDLPIVVDGSRSKSQIPPKTLKAQITEKDTRIAELEGLVSALSAHRLQLQVAHDQLSLDNQNLRHQKRTLVVANTSLNCLKRKAETTFHAELNKRHKRIKRLERERTTKQEGNTATLSSLQDTLNENSMHIFQLQRDLASANKLLTSRDSTIISLQSHLKEKQSALTQTRSLLYASRKQTQRAQTSLQEIRKAYRQLQTWNPMEHGSYSAASRELARDLSYAGCSAGKVEFVVKSCARAFGRAIDEGGKYGEIQLAREIMEAPGFVESSDGTTHRGITVESRHITLLAPSYAPGVDDSDTSTWTHRTRFVEVAPALEHTGQRQFQGTLEAANRIADTYSRSPLAAQEKRVMDKNDYWRKKLGESKDHAADGKKEFNLSAQHKQDIVIRDLGRSAMSEADVGTSRILLTMLNITDDELQAAGNISETDLAALSTAERSSLVEEVLESKLGEDKFNSLTPEQQSNACTHVFGGCCSHKDLNVLRYGVKKVESIYATYNIPPPVLLANKANSATINLSSGNPNDAALQNAIESSSSGAIKLLQLIGALLRHKDEERGYQDRCTIFMQERKLELFDLDEPGKFPDVSNTRYGCYTYAAAEVVCFHGIIQELVIQVIDGKTKSGQPNHVEYLILKGMNCSRTMEQLVGLALYGVCVSWRYMALVRGTKENPINLLSLTDLHRKLPKFCTHIADNPHILLDPTTPLDQLTIDGQPFVNDLLLPIIRQLLPDLPNIFLVISHMFSGCAEGWIHFTPEFHVGGTFDLLTPEQRAILFIPSTNDCSEGMLGSYRVHMRYHPNSTAHSFSNQTRTERNNTEAFIKKVCDAAVQQFVMREVRKDGASGVQAKFRRAWAALQREKAENALKRREKAAAKKKLAAFRLATTQLEFSVDKIKVLSSPLLKAQLRVYRDVLKDGILLKLRWKDMETVAVRRKLVLEARERELARRKSIEPSSSEIIGDSDSPKDTVIEEYGYSAGDDAEWEDLPE